MSRCLIVILSVAVLSTACRSDGPPAPADPTPAVDPPVVDLPAATPPALAPEGDYLSVLPKDAGSPTVDAIKNLDRIPGLTDTHKQQLEAHRFFVTAQSVPKPTQDPGEARSTRRAKHLFQVYERNDYIRFPSYVTVDLAIDLTHQYFEAVLRKVEREHLAPRLAEALTGFVSEASRLRKAAKTKQGRAAARAAELYWGTALRLLEQPASGDKPDEPEVRSPWFGDPEMEAEMGTDAKPKPPPPKITKLGDLEKEVSANVRKVHAASSKTKFSVWGIELDLTQTKPRSHYAGSGVMQRYFRAMSFLGMSTFALEGEDARPAVVAMLARSYAGRKDASESFDSVLEVTNFVVGEPPTSGLKATVEAMQKLRPKIKVIGADELVESKALEEAHKGWMSFAPHPIERNGPVMQPIGQRVFADTLAMASLLGAVRDAAPSDAPFVKRSMGALGSAAAMGSDRALELVATVAPDQAAVTSSLKKGRTLLAGALDRDDAYHRTLKALGAYLGADPLYLAPEAYELRALSGYAGGWAMLRHDTLLYAYEMGAECDAEEFPPPPGWVEPVPETYAALRGMVESFGERIADAGIVPDKPPSEEDVYEEVFHTLPFKTEVVAGLLGKLETWARKELKGEPFTEEERTEIAMVGGAAEHAVLVLADAFELGPGNDDMAVVADVFSWRGQALEVGVSHPELIYAVIPSPEGWVLARGAVLGYREFFVPRADRMTDEQWRERLAKSKDFEFGTRPAWLEPITAPPVGVVKLAPKQDPQERCGYSGGYFEI